MLIVCPSCKTRFSLDDGKVGAEGIKLRCSKCRAIFRVVRKAAPPLEQAPGQQPALSQAAPQEAKKTAPSAASAPAPAPANDRIKVVVAHESASFCAAVQRVLAPEPFDVFIYNDGRETLNAIEQLLPSVVLLDVALPSMYGFEVCDAVRKNPALATVKTILIASIYDKTRYKRSPKSLYGADDYIEKHHIPDSLAAMVYRLVAGQKPVEAPSDPAVMAEEEGHVSSEELSRQEVAEQEATRQELRKNEELETSVAVAPSTPELAEAHVKAKRLARIIVSDIVLYNQPLVEEGVRNRNLFRLLADDIREGSNLYELRVPAEVRAGTNYLKDAFDELIAKKQVELGL
ncbi:MAG: histidine kinase [Geobacter sp.]|nr:MAG: histidine kinase [Geobacter sp.]